MKQDKSPPSMDSTMKPLENTETQTHGNTALKYLITLELELLSKEKFSAFMVVFHQKSKQSIR